MRRDPLVIKPAQQMQKMVNSVNILT